MNFLSRSFCGLFCWFVPLWVQGRRGVGSLAGEKLPVCLILLKLLWVTRISVLPTDSA